MGLTIMYAMPRSMTQWWRWFFSKGCHAVHDPLSRCTHPNDLRKLDVDFIVDTSAIFFHDRLRVLFPEHKAIYMIRSPYDVEASLRAQHRTCNLQEQYTRLMHHAYGADDNVRLHYGCVRPEYLQALTLAVTGKQYGEAADLQQRIDIPLREQYRDPLKIQSLMRYKDKL
jgi:hypothetical protein